jgi:hypothetical protein
MGSGIFICSSDVGKRLQNSYFIVDQALKDHWCQVSISSNVLGSTICRTPRPDDVQETIRSPVHDKSNRFGACSFYRAGSRRAAAVEMRIGVPRASRKMVRQYSGDIQDKLNNINKLRSFIQCDIAFLMIVPQEFLDLMYVAQLAFRAGRTGDVSG